MVLGLENPERDHEKDNMVEYSRSLKKPHPTPCPGLLEMNLEIKFFLITSITKIINEFYKRSLSSWSI